MFWEREAPPKLKPFYELPRLPPRGSSSFFFHLVRRLQQENQEQQEREVWCCRSQELIEWSVKSIENDKGRQKRMDP